MDIIICKQPIIFWFKNDESLDDLGFSVCIHFVHIILNGSNGFPIDRIAYSANLLKKKNS